MEGLLDFGTGAIQGGLAGAKVSGGNPYAAGAGALALGTLSLFGGAGNRRLERESNRLSLAQGKQNLRLGELSVAQAEREDRARRDAEKKRKQFGQMLGAWFANRQKAAVV